MESEYLKNPTVGLSKGIFVLVLGFVIAIGWFILILAAINALSAYIPVLVSIVSPGRSLVTGIFSLIVSRPLISIPVLVLGGYVLERFHMADWL
jgi:TRAP-type mannitol/chloroaromatic compound transport system permease large subunit